MIVLGCDPGLAFFGWAAVDVRAKPRLVALGTIATEKNWRKGTVLVADDNVQRVRLLGRDLAAKLLLYKAEAICAEAMSYPPGAKPAHMLGLAWGCMAQLANVFALPIVAASPQEIKQHACGKRNASKNQVEAAVRERYAADAMVEAVPRKHREHACDAAAAVLACLQSEVIRAVRKKYLVETLTAT